MMIKVRNGKGKDVLGFVFEYFLGQFADTEGKKGGQFYTPQSIVKILVDMLAPEPEKRVHDVIANPPFNVSDYNINKAETHKWKFGVLPTGNANHAWLQLFVSKLAPYCTTEIVLANGSMSSEIATEGEIRKAMIEADLLDCVVSLPSKLFYNTQIPACMWFLARNKPETAKFRNRTNEVLFIDARELGTMISRKQKELWDEDIAPISDTYHKWRSKASGLGFAGLKDDRDLTAKSKKSGESINRENPDSDYVDIPGFCKSANIQDFRKNNYILTPGRYIDFKEEEDGQVFDQKMQLPTSTLSAQMQKANELDEAIKIHLAKIGFEI